MTDDFQWRKRLSDREVANCPETRIRKIASILELCGVDREDAEQEAANIFRIATEAIEDLK